MEKGTTGPCHAVRGRIDIPQQYPLALRCMVRMSLRAERSCHIRVFISSLSLRSVSRKKCKSRLTRVSSRRARARSIGPKAVCSCTLIAPLNGGATGRRPGRASDLPLSLPSRAHLCSDAALPATTGQCRLTSQIASPATPSPQSAPATLQRPSPSLLVRMARNPLLVHDADVMHVAVHLVVVKALRKRMQAASSTGSAHEEGQGRERERERE